MPAGYDSPHPPPPPPPPGGPPPPHGPPPAHGPPPPGPPPGFGIPGFDFNDFFNGPHGRGGHFQRFDSGPHHHGPPGFGPGGHAESFGRRGPRRGGRGPRGGDTDEDYAEMMEQFREWGGRGHHGRRGHGRRGEPREEQEDTNDESGPEGFVDVNGEEREGSRPPPRGPHGHGRHGRHFGGPPPPPPPPPGGEAWGEFGFGGPWRNMFGGPWGFGPHGHHGRGGFGRGKKPFPRVDILANDAQIVLEVELPGVRKENITARVDDDGSAITVEGTFPARAEGELKRVYGERRVEAGESFVRTIPLPGPVDKESVRAKLADGVLTVTLAKVQVEEPQGTPVNIE